MCIEHVHFLRSDRDDCNVISLLCFLGKHLVLLFNLLLLILRQSSLFVLVEDLLLVVLKLHSSLGVV